MRSVAKSIPRHYYIYNPNDIRVYNCCSRLRDFPALYISIYIQYQLTAISAIRTRSRGFVFLLARVTTIHLYVTATASARDAGG